MTYEFMLDETIGYQDDGERIIHTTYITVEADNDEEAIDKAFDKAEAIVAHEATLYSSDGEALYDYDDGRCLWEWAGCTDKFH